MLRSLLSYLWPRNLNLVLSLSSDLWPRDTNMVLSTLVSP